MNFQVSTLKRIGLCGLASILLCGVAFAQSITGVVTNKTTNKPSAGDDVVLLKLAQGMQELARAKTDGKGRFTLQVPDEGLHLVRVTHDKANYFRPVQPGTQSIEVEVYTAAAQVEGVTLDADVMRLQTDASGTGLKVVEHFFMKNESSPAKTLFSDHPFELYLPPGAVVEGSAAKAPGGMAVQSALVPMGDPNHFTIIFPIRPGETEFQISYHLPYKDSFSFQPRPTMATDTIAIMMPKSMTFKPVPSAPYNAVTEELGAQTFVARGVQPSQPLGFTISGTGELPRDAGAGQTSGDAGAVGSKPAGNADPSTDTRPGGGIGVPVDKDAVRESWVSKYRWALLAGLFLLFSAGAGLMFVRPSKGEVAGTPKQTEGYGGALQVLRNEMFSVETDRLEGRINEDQYAELKSAFDVVLRRALARNPSAAQVVQE